MKNSHLERSCRFCCAALHESFVNLGMSPMSNAYLKPTQLNNAEAFYPLHAYLCEKCLLVQLEEFESPAAIFSDYAYFSSYSDTWLAHSREYAEHMIPRLGLSGRSLVVELASNDGYLLQYFHQARVPVLGIEPAANVAEVATKKGIPTRTEFFGREYAQKLRVEGIGADLIVANNVLAHVPDLNGFVAGMKTLLNPNGVISVEFPHLLRLIEENQFDTIYHEHFSYFSLITVDQIFRAHGLRIFDVEQLPTHGGSLRIFGCHADATNPPGAAPDRVAALFKLETDAGLRRVETYRRFADRVRETKRTLLSFLIRAKSDGLSIVGYGAAAKGNTLLNYCGIREDFVDYVVDRSPHKQGLFLPGTHLPIRSPDEVQRTKPAYVLILPWNIKNEVAEQMSYIRSWGGKFVVPIPTLTEF